MSSSASSPLAKTDSHSYAQRNAAYWRRNLAICVFGSFTTLVSLTLLLPFLPIYVEQLGVHDKAAIVVWSGIAFGATFLGTGLTAPLWGYLSDRYGRRPMLIRAAVGMALLMPLIGLAHNVWQLVLLRLAAGLIGGYASSATVLVATQTPREQAGWALGILSTGSLSGGLIGPLIGGLLPGLIGIRQTFFLGGGVIALAALVTIVFVREDFQAAPASARRAEPVRLGSALWLVVAPMFATAMLVLFSNMSIEPIITVYLAEIGVGRSQVVLFAGIVMAASALGSLLMAARLGRLADRIGGGKVIIYCLLAAGGLLIPQAFVTQWWQLVGLRFLMGMALAGLLPSIAKVIRLSVPEKALGKVLGYAQSSQYAGQVLGPLLGGALGGTSGMRSVFFLTSALLLAGAGLNYLLMNKARAALHPLQ
ncbi:MULTISPECIES: MFS transporter [unclassified Janthinobacterium]|uniref:MFS transporter n=1 Tax=unclassified Janthinobacterium TaxID=2610881 RepID=UPI0016149A77|nr:MULTISPECIES: MFS transporter [unclassified Janthinobacterium]MBB5609852.1 DHA1 family multidrug resistance protein-like MFS transporter [Janthinobacterium sp. S3T4]MBB5615118.1 DHA1 family multidrug resistance protein-like MFS transporter [Janthinobacterium sp. S3M3]